MKSAAENAVNDWERAFDLAMRSKGNTQQELSSQSEHDVCANYHHQDRLPTRARITPQEPGEEAETAALKAEIEALKAKLDLTREKADYAEVQAAAWQRQAESAHSLLDRKLARCGDCSGQALANNKKTPTARAAEVSESRPG